MHDEHLMKWASTGLNSLH